MYLVLKELNFGQKRKIGQLKVPIRFFILFSAVNTEFDFKRQSFD